MIDLDRQNEVQALSGPVIEEAIARMANCGIKRHEVAQALILTGAGLLAGALGPKGAGFALRDVSSQIEAMLIHTAKSIEDQPTC